MTWFVAMIVMIDMVSGSVYERHMQKRNSRNSNEEDAAPAQMPAFHRECYFSDRDAMVTQRVKGFPESAGWQKLRAPGPGVWT